jgi:hypothetical protein
VFGLNLAGQGTVELQGIGFTDLTNTHTISAGTLTLFFWDELSSPTAFALAGAADTTATLNAAGTAVVGSLIQIDSEVLEVTAVAGASYTVARGSHGSTAAGHLVGAKVYHLQRNVTIVPFVKNFFGSPASGSYSASVFLPDVRVAAAEFFVTNGRGSSLVSTASFGATVDQGLRTLSGGQLSIQVDGYLAVQTDAAPPLVMDTSLAARDIFAVVREAPSGGAVELRVRLDDAEYCTLTIADGATISNSVSGFGLGPLSTGRRVRLDIVSVPGAAGTLPGRDLTVTVRL